MYVVVDLREGVQIRKRMLIFENIFNLKKNGKRGEAVKMCMVVGVREGVQIKIILILFKYF